MLARHHGLERMEIRDSEKMKKVAAVGEERDYYFPYRIVSWINKGVRQNVLIEPITKMEQYGVWPFVGHMPVEDLQEMDKELERILKTL